MNIIGRLTRNAEVRTTANDKKLVSFTVAENESFKSKSGERIKRTTYFDCAYWISTNIATILTKGTLVEISGRVEARAWNDGDGNTRTGLNLNASRITVHGGGTKADQINENSSKATSPSEPQTEDLPF